MIDPGPKQPENRIHLFDPVGLANEKYANYGVRPRHATSSNNNFAGTSTATGAREGGLKFAVEPKVADSDSESSSPRLWNINSRSSPPTSPKFRNSPQHPLQSNNRQSLTHQPFHPYPEPMSPSSRTQAIARGRRELMEMIKDIPESCYELSLRDIVDHKPLTTPPPRPPPPAAVVAQQPPQESKKVEVVEKKFPQQEALEATKAKKGKEIQSKKKKGSKKVGKSDSKKKMMKNKSVDNGGFLLKTSVFPIPFRSKKKKRGLNPAPSFKVAPKPPSKGPVKGAEKRWWVRKSRVSSDSGGLNGESPTSSNSSSRSSSIIVNRHRLPSHRFLPSCCAFFNDKKMIKAKK